MNLPNKSQEILLMWCPSGAGNRTPWVWTVCQGSCQNSRRIPLSKWNENMETWVPKLLESWIRQKWKLSRLRWYALLPGGEEEEEGHDHGGEGHHHDYDPHVWLSTSTRHQNCRAYPWQLVSADYPDKKETFWEECSCLYWKIVSIGHHRWVCLKEAKSFVTQHAFRYLALDYGLK